MIKLVKRANNFYRVDLPDGASIWFSYETPVAVDDGSALYCSQNMWSNTTGKHLNMVQKDKSKRVPYHVVEDKIKELFK